MRTLFLSIKEKCSQSRRHVPTTLFDKQPTYTIQSGNLLVLFQVTYTNYLKILLNYSLFIYLLLNLCTRCLCLNLACIFAGSNIFANFENAANIPKPCIAAITLIPATFAIINGCSQAFSYTQQHTICELTTIEITYHFFRR